MWLRGRGHSAPLFDLEAGAAQHRPALGGPEGHRRLIPAAGTLDPGLRAHSPAATSSLRLARLTVFRVVLELLVEEEKLFACGEYEILTAIHALQNSIGEFHGRLPKDLENCLAGHG